MYPMLSLPIVTAYSYLAIITRICDYLFVLRPLILIPVWSFYLIAAAQRRAVDFSIQFGIPGPVSQTRISSRLSLAVVSIVSCLEIESFAPSPLTRLSSSIAWQALSTRLVTQRRNISLSMLIVTFEFNFKISSILLSIAESGIPSPRRSSRLFCR